MEAVNVTRIRKESKSKNALVAAVVRCRVQGPTCRDQGVEGFEAIGLQGSRM